VSGLVEQWNAFAPFLPVVPGVDPLWALVPVALLALVLAVLAAHRRVVAVRLLGPGLDPLEPCAVPARRPPWEVCRAPLRLTGSRPRAPAIAGVAASA